VGYVHATLKGDEVDIMHEDDASTSQGREKMRYRTFVLLTAGMLTGVGVLATALVTLTDPGANWRFGLLASLGFGVFALLSLSVAWRVNRDHLEKAGFRRW
jgi:predicted cobalt transporter CbtA